MGIFPPTCDVSFLSGCAECNNDGSCTCQSYTTAEADLLTRDQTYWGGTINACPTLPILMYVLYSIALLGSVFAGVRCTYALVMQTKLARRLSRRWVEHRPNWVCAMLILSTLFNAGFCIDKLVDPEKVIGVDILPSALYAASRSMFYTGATTQIVDFFAVAMSVQESTYGQQRIREALAKEHLLFILPAVHTCVECIPLVNAILAVDRDYNMERVQTICLIFFLVGNACCFSFGCTRLVLRAKKMLASFEQSKDALESSYVVAVGGRAMADKFLDPDANGISPMEVPASLQTVINDLHSLEQAQKNVSKHSTKIMKSCIVVIVLNMLFAIVPFLWDKTSYLIAVNSIILPLGLSQEVAANYITNSKKRNELPARPLL
mmetsp:Transcript_13268/g.25787  ORF Transcript_13268/g.25787 Transcript_13268/m.25787 type:complete len:378 (-) Transcript_13268:240-1373(-)